MYISQTEAYLNFPRVSTGSQNSEVEAEKKMAAKSAIFFSVISIVENI